MGGSGLPDHETRDEVLARIRAEHGDSVAAIVERDWERNTKGGKGKNRRRGAPDVRHGWTAGTKGREPKQGAVAARHHFRTQGRRI